MNHPDRLATWDMRDRQPGEGMAGENSTTEPPMPGDGMATLTNGKTPAKTTKPPNLMTMVL